MTGRRQARKGRPDARKPAARAKRRTAAPEMGTRRKKVESQLVQALERQTATTEVLRIISRSSFDLQAVLQLLTEAAARLCSADMASIARQRGNGFYHATNVGFPSDWVELAREWAMEPGRGSINGRALASGRIEHVRDVLADPEYTFFEPQEKAGYRTFLSVPMLRDGRIVGLISLCRRAVRPFTRQQIDLVSSFADQAVIAIENVRLFDEVKARTQQLDESLRQQTATADVLKLISRSAFDLPTALSTLLETAAHLCEADFGNVAQPAEAGLFRVEATYGTSARSAEVLKQPLHRAGRGSAIGRALQEGTTIHILDAAVEPDYEMAEVIAIDGFRTLIGVPLLRDGVPIGVFALGRRAVRPFTDRQIELATTFADQAAIAIENARLVNELRGRTEELNEALQQQTATADVLKVISRSAFDLKTVLHTLVESAARLADADKGVVTRMIDGEFYRAESFGVSQAFTDYVRTIPVRPERGSAVGRALLEGVAVHIPDYEADPDYTFTAAQQYDSFRTMLGIPLMREGSPIGVLVVARSEVRPFTDKQIELVITFADQAAIAIENSRLFEEVQARTRALEELLQQQTATSEILKIVSASLGELEPVFQVILQNAVHLCEAKFAMLLLYEQERNEFRAVGQWNLPVAYSEFLGKNGIRADPMIPLGRIVSTKRPVQVPDVRQDPSYLERFPGIIAVVDLGGARTLLQVPLLKEDELIGTFGIYRQEVRQFTDKQVELVEDFAAQAVIAIENARLLNELRQRTNDLTRSLDELRNAQDRLVQTEKLASLGQLTAGIAHEIKNPLNFINNFSSLSAELIDEMSDALGDAGLGHQKRDELAELTQTLKSNLERVVQHGRRADSIVKNMLLHSRQGSGDRRSVEINAIVDESLNLAYHGARAERPGFNITLERKLDPTAGQVNVYPQEVTRVLLNIISNGFYAAANRAKEAANGFEPVLSAETRNLGDRVEIRMRDNGIGIPADVKAKIFTPFFTTKPPGEGTGLGLSMSHDIIVKQHGGMIDVDTEPGVFTEFIITLPREAAHQKNTGSQR